MLFYSSFQLFTPESAAVSLNASVVFVVFWFLLLVLFSLGMALEGSIRAKSAKNVIIIINQMDRFKFQTSQLAGNMGMCY
jgi:hypothetical protein